MKTIVNFFETQRLMLGHANTDVLKGWHLLSNPDRTDSKNLSEQSFNLGDVTCVPDDDDREPLATEVRYNGNVEREAEIEEDIREN